MPLPMAFEEEMLTALIPEKEITLQSLIDVRGRFIDSFYERFNDYYDVSILDFQRQVRESGHWQAYNMFLMGHGDPDAYQQWAETDPTAEVQMDAFAKWYSDHPFMPTAEKPTLRLKAYRLINLDIPAREQVSNAKECRKYSADALRLARWWLDQPLDTHSYIQDQVQRFLITWCMNSDIVERILEASIRISSTPFPWTDFKYFFQFYRNAHPIGKRSILILQSHDFASIWILWLLSVVHISRCRI